MSVLRKTMIVGLCGFHLSVQAGIEDVVFEIHGKKFVLSTAVHQFLKMSSHSLTNFAVNRDHETTVMFEVEILSSFARDLCSAAQHFVYTSGSSFQRSGANSFHHILETAKHHHQESIHHWQSDRIFHLLLHLDQNTMEMCSLQLLTASDHSWHQDQDFQ